jgi:hypothetical protein
VKWHAMLRHFIDDFGVEQEIDVIHQQRFWINHCLLFQPNEKVLVKLFIRFLYQSETRR